MRYLQYGEEFEKKYADGLIKGCTVTARTLGPHGRNVDIQHDYGTHKIINDGARIINGMNLQDDVENAGLWVAKNCSAKTNDDVGDGTTTTLVLLKAIVEESLKRTQSRAEIKKSLEEALPKVIELLKQSAVPMKDEDIEQVVYLISEHKDIARFLNEIYQKLGRDAAIQIEDSKATETTYEIEDGYRLHEGYANEAFFTDPQTRKASYTDVPIIVATQKLDKTIDIAPIAQQLQEAKITKAVFFVQDISDDMLGFMIKNKLPPPYGTGGFQSVVVKCLPEHLEDIAAITGAKVIGRETGTLWEKLKLTDLGIAQSVVCDKNSTLIQADVKSAGARAMELSLLAADEPNMVRKSRLEERAARLRGKIAILKVGGYTEVEREYKELKAEDAIKALPAAFEEGLVEGAGFGWSDIADKLEGKTVGEQILKLALNAPLHQLGENQGDGTVSLENIVDPCKVERVSLENAVSSAALFITTVAALLEPNDTAKK